MSWFLLTDMFLLFLTFLIFMFSYFYYCSYCLLNFAYFCLCVRIFVFLLFWQTMFLTSKQSCLFDFLLLLFCQILSCVCLFCLFLCCFNMCFVFCFFVFVCFVLFCFFVCPFLSKVVKNPVPTACNPPKTLVMFSHLTQSVMQKCACVF